PRVGDAGGVDQYPPAASGRPVADLDRLVAMDEQRGPGLFQGQGVNGHEGMVRNRPTVVKSCRSPRAAIGPTTFSTIHPSRRPVMRKTLTLSVLAAVLAGFASAAEMKVASTTSKIEFIGTKTGGRHTGGFKEFTGSVDMTGGDLAGAKITIE